MRYQWVSVRTDNNCGVCFTGLPNAKISEQDAFMLRKTAEKMLSLLYHWHQRLPLMTGIFTDLYWRQWQKVIFIDIPQQKLNKSHKPALVVQNIILNLQTQNSEYDFQQHFLSSLHQYEMKPHTFGLFRHCWHHIAVDNINMFFITLLVAMCLCLWVPVFRTCSLSRKGLDNSIFWLLVNNDAAKWKFLTRAGLAEIIALLPCRLSSYHYCCCLWE
jgi:hypothetical protein